MRQQAQEYRRRAKQAREMAAILRKEDDRQFWLNLAAQWDWLADDLAKQTPWPEDDLE